MPFAFRRNHLTAPRVLCCATAVVGVSLAFSEPAWSTRIPIDPKGTYRRTSQDNGSLPAQMIRLADYGFGPGDIIVIGRDGKFSYDGVPSHTSRLMLGVFDSTNVVLNANNQFRLPGAIASPRPDRHFETPNTFNGGFQTDIPQDFYIARTIEPDTIRVRIPPKGYYLFIDTGDSLLGDNLDPCAPPVPPSGPNCVSYALVILSVSAVEENVAVHSGTEVLPGLFVSPDSRNGGSDVVNLILQSEDAANVNLSVHDIRGALVRDLGSSRFDAGEHRVTWNRLDAFGRSAPSGVYFVRFGSADRAGAVKVRLIH